ncbi:MAG: hypothetical protein COZ06_04695 [Armatimonadetes bacterium CG_4_10_14_3_um_filter_66_18]|nr:MAG: hypothetical protein COZ06_04695 [Armatimonadetes bacterium CG_4_10_14_3_um_filter_66_18]
MSPLIGTVLSDRYEIAEHLGEGAMAVTYVARDRLLGRMVAVKVLRQGCVSDQQFCRSFQQEAQAAANLAHPHIAAVHDIGRDGDALYMVMELVRGRDLKQLIDEEAPLAPDRAVAIAKQIAEALQVAHAAGIVHRDVKPHNVLITSEDRVKVCDFGIAKAISSDSLSQTRSLIGTANYLSPEQALGKPCVPASDLYSLGVVLFELLTGRVPFTGETPVAIAVKHAHEQPPNPADLVPAIPQGLARIVLRALSKEVAARYQSAQELLADLSSGGATQAARPPSQPAWQDQTMVQAPPSADRTVVRPYDRPQLPPPPRRAEGVNPWLLVFVALLGIGLAAGFVVYGMRHTRTVVTVPDVVGISLAEAEARLSAAQLRPGTVTQRTMEGVDPDQVLEQDPVANTEVEQFATVNLVVSEGTKVEIVPVPDVTDMSADKAAQLLAAAGLQRGDSMEEEHETVPAGYVIRQSPRPGSNVERDTAVDLIVSKGPKPPEEPTEPEPPAEPTEPGGGTTNPAPPDTGPPTPSPTTPAPDASGTVQGQVKFTVPEGAGQQKVKIILRDSVGETVVYDKTAAPGDKISETVRGKGRGAKAAIYLNGELVQEIELKPM